MATPRSCRLPLRFTLALLRLHLWVALMLTAAAGPSAVTAEEIQGTAYWGRSEPWTEPGLNVLDDTSATFFWEGHRYELSATDTPALRARSVLEEAIATLAPGLAIDCFHRRTPGAWGDLPKAGLGDPRTVLPAG